MKFIDELDIERLNQTLNFETSDCKINGGCDIFTTKDVASDRKLYKTIEEHLDLLLRETEEYNALVHQNQERHKNRNGDISSFWAQKRRISVSTDNNNPGHYSPFFNSNENVEAVSDSKNNEALYLCSSNGHLKSNKLNDENLKELVSQTDSGYLSSTSNESGNHSITSKVSRKSSNSSLQNIPFTPGKIKHSSLSTTVVSGNNNKVYKTTKVRRHSSLNDAPPNINIGPFGPINETSSRKTFTYLVAILNASYPDHDFSMIEPNDFVQSDLLTLKSKFENSLYSLGRNPDSQTWEIIGSHMDLEECIIYQYKPQSYSFLDDEPGHLWSQLWFLFNRKRKRVAFLYIICSRLKVLSSEFYEKDNEEKSGIIDDTVGLASYEGEYDLVQDDMTAENESDIDPLDM